MSVDQLPPPEIEGLTYISKLGSGGFADVYLFQQAAPLRQVAVKVLRDATLSPRTVKNFTAEANAMARLEHSHIVPVYATGTTRDNRPYIVMKYYAHDSLAARARRERFSVPETLRLGIQLGSAIETAHRAGLLHKDIKPANVLTDAFGKPGLTDFGIAGQITDVDDPETGVSVPWSPPETLYGTGPASVRSDVYSLAATLWHLLAGRSPFDMPGGDNSAFALMKRVRDVPPPSTGRGDVPPSLDRLLRAAMSKEPSLRPSSVREFIGALQSIEQELRLPSTPAELAVEPSRTPLPAAPVADATRMRGARVIDPGGPPGPSNSHAVAPPMSDAPTQRRGASAPPVTGYDPDVVGATQLRAAADAPAPADEPPGPTRGRVIALVGVLLVVVVGVGWSLTTGQRAPRPTASIPASQPPPGVIDRVGPGELEVTATRVGDKVTFAWTYASSLPDDQVVWRVQGTTTSNTAGPTDTVEKTSPGRVCLEVRVFRSDGLTTGGDRWTAKCA